MRNYLFVIGSVFSCIANLIGCTNDKKFIFDYNEYCKKLRISKIVVTTYPSKFGKIDYTDGFVSGIYTYDTNGYVIKEVKFYNDKYLRDLNHTDVYLFTKNYGICRIEHFDSNNKLENIYIDSLINKKTVERKIFDTNNQLTNLVRHKYIGENLVETIMYDSKGNIESREETIYKDNKSGISKRYDSYGNNIERTVTYFYDNYTVRTVTDKDGKITFRSKTKYINGLQVIDDYTFFNEKGNDSTVYKDEYSYQDSLLYKQKLKYENNQIVSAEVYTIYNRE